MTDFQCNVDLIQLYDGCLILFQGFLVIVARLPCESGLIPKQWWPDSNMIWPDSNQMVPDSNITVALFRYDSGLIPIW